jgi:acyl-[acyl-carrier-protein]-phospholipid O-acyltransferase/long-chain-fatty-acid--[acyl-carrier-protein] ligase
MKAEKPGVLQAIDSDGWHDSGDIVEIDENGYVAIHGRIKRFAKVAGEMVSLGAVELIVKGLWPEEEHAVVCVPDKRKGERLVLVTTRENAESAPIKKRSKEEGLTELMVPKDIVTVDDIPLLGSGKTDYVSTRKIALSELGLDEVA